MPKPPVREILRFTATSRMLGWLTVVLLTLLIPTVGADLAREFLFPRPIAAAVSAVPELSWTVDGSRYSPPVFAFLPGTLPSPGPNQIKDAEKCEFPARMVRGGCWVLVGEQKPPCKPPLWPDDEGRCWLPVAKAAPVPTSGGSYPATIAE